MIKKLDHVFVDTMPDELEEGILYVSIRFSVIMHLCCCGCKNKVITPLSPARWKMTYDGKTISLHPSIGNWNFECESHYWVTNSEVITASKWTKKEVSEGKVYERSKRKAYYQDVNQPEKKKSLIERIKKYLHV